jgi:hypothetical protein
VFLFLLYKVIVLESYITLDGKRASPRQLPVVLPYLFFVFCICLLRVVLVCMCVSGLCDACIVGGSAVNAGMEELVGVAATAVHVHGGVGADMGGGWMSGSANSSVG